MRQKVKREVEIEELERKGRWCDARNSQKSNRETKYKEIKGRVTRNNERTNKDAKDKEKKVEIEELEREKVEIEMKYEN